MQRCCSVLGLALAVAVGCLTPTATAAISAEIDQRSIVHVVAYETSGAQRVLTGAVVDSDGERAIIATNAHLFRDPIASIEVRSHGGTAPAQVLYIGRLEAEDDVAILIARLQGLPAIPLAEQDPAIGDQVQLAGYPRGGPQLARHSARLISRTANGSLVGNCPVIQGESGSPVIDTSGRLVALNWGSDGQGCYLVPVGRVRAGLRRIVAAGKRLLTAALETQFCSPGDPCWTPQPRAIAQPQGSAPSLNQLVDQLAQDPRLRGPAGPPGIQGPPGERGPPGRDGMSPDPSAIAQAVAPLLSVSTPEPKAIPEAGDWLATIQKIAAALGLQVAIPGGSLGAVAFFALRSWLRYRIDAKRVDASRPQAAPIPPPIYDAGRSSAPAPHPSQPRS